MSKVHLIHQGVNQEVDFLRYGHKFTLSKDDFKLEGEILLWKAPQFKIKTKDQILDGLFFKGKSYFDIHLSEGNFRVQFPKRQSRGAESALTEGDILAPMPGKVLKCLIQEGDTVEAGDCLMIIEAMKMEHKILSPSQGEVKQVLFREGDRVAQGDELLKVQ